MRIVPILGAAIAAALISTPVFAAELTGTLKKIKDSGTITLAPRQSIPFSYIADASGKPVGYSHDIQLAVVEALKKNCPTSRSSTTWSPRKPVSRWCRTAPSTSSAAPPPTTPSAAASRLLGRHLRNRHPPADQERLGVQDFADLKGKNVVTTAGTTSERILKAMNADKQMGMNVISAKDHGESFNMLESGRAVAFMMDDALLAGEMAKAKKPDDWVITGTPQSFEIYGCMVRKDDPAFKKAVDDAIVHLQVRRDQQDLRQVVQQPIPPKA
jgi:glutamate/aspartate transport system substrate-binding protein